MRSDWDDAYREQPDIQKRSPTISENEWRYILSLLLDRLKDLRQVSPDSMAVRHGDALVKKIEQRIREAAK